MGAPETILKLCETFSAHKGRGGVTQINIL